MSDDNAPASPATPREALDLLLAGNQRFTAGTPRHPHQDAGRRADTASAQRPYAVLPATQAVDLPLATAMSRDITSTSNSR